MSIAKLFLGLILLIFCLALSIIAPSIFNFSSDVEELLQYGFLALGMFCMIYGVLK